MSGEINKYPCEGTIQKGSTIKESKLAAYSKNIETVASQSEIVASKVFGFSRQLTGNSSIAGDITKDRPELGFFAKLEYDLDIIQTNLSRINKAISEME